MDKRAFRNFITKRSTVWTLSLCMTGILVLGGIAAVNKARRGNDAQSETEIGQVAYLEEEIDSAGDGMDALFPTLDEKMTEDLALASGNTVEEGEGLSGEAAEGMDEEAGVQVSADGANVGGTDDTGSTGVSETAENADAVETAGNAGDTEDTGNTGAVGTAGEAGSMADSPENTGADAAEEASSGQILSEQVLTQNGIDFTEESSLMWPSAGTILIDYSMDGSVYFPTLNQYKYNPALIIGSDVGNQVLAAAKGIVESVTIDEVTGNTLVLNLGNGYKLTYGQLKELAVAEGDVVEEGALLGYVSEPTKYYSREGSNLYFAMTQNDEAVDPVLYLE